MMLRSVALPPPKVLADALRLVGSAQPQEELHLAAHADGEHAFVARVLQAEQPLVEPGQALLGFPGEERARAITSLSRLISSIGVATSRQVVANGSSARVAPWRSCS